MKRINEMGELVSCMDRIEYSEESVECFETKSISTFESSDI